MQLQEKIISFENAKRLKELGILFHSFAYYVELRDGRIIVTHNNIDCVPRDVEK